jgi:large subunit ribosomal protein L21
MFAIVEIRGNQFKVSENQNLFVPKLQGEAGSKVEFEKVLMYSPDDKKFEIGAPSLNMKVEATIVNHLKDDKVVVFKKKKRKGYKVTKGHKQQFTEIAINKIS